MLLSAVQPSAGLMLGLLYVRQDDRPARHFGRWCVAVAVAAWILAAATGAVKTALGSGEWFVQPYY